MTDPAPERTCPEHSSERSGHATEPIRRFAFPYFGQFGLFRVSSSGTGQQVWVPMVPPL